MNLDFSGKTALVTGASRGIGRQIAIELARCGARLVVTSTRSEHATELRELLGPDTRHLAVDLGQRTERDRFLAEVAELDALHVLVNNAGTTRHGPLESATEEDWDVTCDVDLKAPWLLLRAVAGVMKRQRYGRVVNIGSIWSYISMAERSIYTAAKFGLRGITVSAAIELGPHGVLVNALCPGFTMTDMVARNYTEERLAELRAQIPLGRLGSVEDMARAVVFLCSDFNSYITGQSLIADGGYSIR